MRTYIPGYICPHNVRTTSHKGYMSAQCPHNVGTLSALYPSSVFSSGPNDAESVAKVQFNQEIGDHFGRRESMPGLHLLRFFFSTEWACHCDVPEEAEGRRARLGRGQGGYYQGTG